MSFDSSNIDGYLIDLDGTIYVGDQVVPGAAEAIERLRARDVPFRFNTNATTKSNQTLISKLRGHGVEVRDGELFGTVSAAVAHLRRLGSPRCQLLLTDDPKADFTEFTVDDNEPEQIVIGDIGKYWDYKLVNDLFQKVMAGAGMIALHKGRYWQTEEGLQVDIGAFVAGLEYVTGKEATLIGKPSADFFGLALVDLGLPAERVAMVGDDLMTDIGGAQACGMKGVLVKTGKFREETLALSDVTPDAVLDSIAGLGRDNE